MPATNIKSSRVKSLLRHPVRVLTNRLSPRRRLVRQYAAAFGHPPRLDPPVGFNEHIIHRMLYDRDPMLKIISDKIATKKLVADRAGAKYTVPLLGAWRSAEQIVWDSLPESFVLKPNQTSGPVILVQSRATMEIPVITAEVRSWLRKGSYIRDCEWGYKGIPRSVMAEPLLRGPSNCAALEVQVFTFHGRAALVQLVTGRKFTDERTTGLYDVNGRQMALAVKDRKSARMQLDPVLRREVIPVAEAISAGMSSLRVDFLITAAGPRVGELTPYSWAGHAYWTDPKMDEMVGRLFVSPDTSHIPDFAPESVSLDRPHANDA
jgi:TupA-like ATPgrasp